MMYVLLFQVILLKYLIIVMCQLNGVSLKYFEDMLSKLHEIDVQEIRISHF